MSELLGIAHFKFHEGKREEYLRLSDQAMEIVRAKDSGTLAYDLYLNGDRSECMVIERYRDSDAAIEHAANLGPIRSGPCDGHRGSRRAAWRAERTAQGQPGCQRCAGALHSLPVVAARACHPFLGDQATRSEAPWRADGGTPRRQRRAATGMPPWTTDATAPRRSGARCTRPRPRSAWDRHAAARSTRS